MKKIRIKGYGYIPFMEILAITKKTFTHQDMGKLKFIIVDYCGTAGHEACSPYGICRINNDKLNLCAVNEELTEFQPLTDKEIIELYPEVFDKSIWDIKKEGVILPSKD